MDEKRLRELGKAALHEVLDNPEITDFFQLLDGKIEELSRQYQKNRSLFFKDWLFVICRCRAYRRRTTRFGPRLAIRQRIATIMREVADHKLRHTYITYTPLLGSHRVCGC